MTAPATELQLVKRPTSQWHPGAREPDVCGAELSGDPNCASPETYAVQFTRAGSAAQVTLWLYAAWNPGYYVVACHWQQQAGGMSQVGDDSWTPAFAAAEDATGAAWQTAAALASGMWSVLLGGIPRCLDWDGIPEHMGDQMPLPPTGGMPC